MELFVDLPLRSVGTITAPGLASETTLQSVLDELENINNKENVEDLFFDYSVSNVNNAGWTEIIAATVDDFTHMTWFDSSGKGMEIGIGAVPTRIFVAPPGGFNGIIPCLIPIGTKLSIRCLENVTVQEGQLIANFYK